MNLNTKLTWSKSWEFAKVCLRSPTPGNGLFTLVRAIYLDLTARGMAQAQLELQHLFVERCLPSTMLKELVLALSGPYNLVDSLIYRPGAAYLTGRLAKWAAQ